MRTLFYIFILCNSLSGFTQTHREISEDGIKVKLSLKKAFFGTIDDGTLIDILDGDRLLFTTRTTDSPDEAKREIEAFINLQKLLAASYKKKLLIDVKAAEKSQSAFAEVKALFSIKDPENPEEINSECVDKLQANNAGSLNEKLTNSLIKNKVLAVDQKDIKIVYTQRKTLGVNDGVDVDIFIKGKLVHSLFFGNMSSKDEVYRELTPTITQIRNSKQPVILQFGKSERKSLLMSQTDRFKEIFEQEF